MNRRFFVCLVAALSLCLLVGCAERSGRAGALQGEQGQLQAQNRHEAQSQHEAQLLPGEEFLRVELFFGMSIAAKEDRPAGEVGEAQWRGFLDEWITPRFPYGLTVHDGYGQWMGEDGDIARERSRVLVLLVSGAAPGEWAETGQAIEEIRAAYCRLFHQESVLRVISRAQVAF